MFKEELYMGKEEITPEERKEYAKYMAEADQVFAWAIENENAILEMMTTKEFTDDPDFLTNLAIVAVYALIRYRADIIKENL